MVSYLGEGRRGERPVGGAAQLFDPNFQDVWYVLQTQGNPVFLAKSPQDPKEDHNPRCGPIPDAGKRQLGVRKQLNPLLACHK
jgi:hypothetical protein